MQKKALLDTTMGNYGPKARRFIYFCEQHQRPWLPATEATVLLYIASVLKDGGIKSASLQQYLSAINNYHEDLRIPGPAKGRAVTRVVKGMATIQAELAVQEENIETQRTWLPAGHVRRAHVAALKLTPRSSEELRLLRAFSYVVIAFVTFDRPDTGTSLSRQHVHCGDSEFSEVLLKEKGRRHHRVKRRLCIPWRGVALLRELVLHWEFHRDATWSRSGKTQPDAYWLLPEDPKNFKASVAHDWIGLALSELGCRPPEGGHFSAHSTQKGATTCARAVPFQNLTNLPGILRSLDKTRVREMQTELRCLARRFLWSSVYGRYGNETGADDAFGTLLEVLQTRKLHGGRPGPPPMLASACGLHWSKLAARSGCVPPAAGQLSGSQSAPACLPTEARGTPEARGGRPQMGTLSAAWCSAAACGPLAKPHALPRRGPAWGMGVTPTGRRSFLVGIARAERGACFPSPDIITEMVVK
ncbi:hypothetical protein CYMTET_48883 [Cymbomonas tetramitiformis]|uniref:Core-binding (CB) domain-containing protein n=1 Tax=Cymbomonas tetramitiformis TaxID=36881 RepID=A0AAE0EVA0_9CHLO|nr:hypothetical protein CYMTET_48883 [Cymbomonas tetramitiformis]